MYKGHVTGIIMGYFQPNDNKFDKFYLAKWWTKSLQCRILTRSWLLQEPKQPPNSTFSPQTGLILKSVLARSTNIMIAHFFSIRMPNDINISEIHIEKNCTVTYIYIYIMRVQSLFTH